MAQEESVTGKLPFGPHKGKIANVATKYRATETGKRIAHSGKQSLERVAAMSREAAMSYILDQKFYPSFKLAVEGAKARTRRGKGSGSGTGR